MKKHRLRAVAALCKWCQKALQNSEKKKCIRCLAEYCSKDCQIKDWKEGDHKKNCVLDNSFDPVKEAEASFFASEFWQGEVRTWIMAHLGTKQRGIYVVLQEPNRAMDVFFLSLADLEKKPEFRDPEDKTMEYVRSYKLDRQYVVTIHLTGKQGVTLVINY